MYDTLQVEYPLPGKYKHLQKMTFQTQDLSNMLEQYIINRKGMLMLCDGRGCQPVHYFGWLFFHIYINETDEFIEFEALFGIHGSVMQIRERNI